jgi:gliding motility-associated-like protein
VKAVALTIMLFISIGCLSQSFPANGQLASTAFPICGADTFKQLTVPIGSKHIMSLPNCSADSLEYSDTNPFWYSFTCFSAGTLGFLISPNDLQDDYDWMLYDITGHDPDDAYTNPGLIVTGNWAGTPGLTGAAKGGSLEIKCASFPADSVNTFSSMPELIAGHHYLLFISHYNRTQSGYSMHFGGGTAIIKDTVSAMFSSITDPGCLSDTIQISYPYKNQVNQWQWLIVGTEYTSSEQEPSFIQTGTGSMSLQHIVTNDACSDTATQLIAWKDHPLKASFTTDGGNCPQDPVSFNNTSSGDLVSWFWNFDDGNTSEDKNPSVHLFPDVHGGKIFNVSLIVENSIGCFDTATVQIAKLQSCTVGIPNAFTPNGDGLNDYLYPLNTRKFTNIEFRVYNRSGQIMFESRDASGKWDGRLNNQMQPAGTYVWTLSYMDASGEKINTAGTTILIR